MAVGEAWVADDDRLAHYAASDELNLAFNFKLIQAPWGADTFADAIRRSMAAMAAVRAPCTWVLANHDVDRAVTRYGGGAIGMTRARAAALVMLSLPGAAYVYNGDELGLRQRRPARRRRCRIRPGSAAGTPRGAGTASGCRCRGPATRRRSDSPPAVVLAADAGVVGVADRRKAGRRPDLDAARSTVLRSGCAAPRTTCTPESSGGSTPRRTASPTDAATSRSCSTPGPGRRRCRPAKCCSRPAHLTARRYRRTRQPGSGRASRGAGRGRGGARRRLSRKARRPVASDRRRRPRSRRRAPGSPSGSWR